MKLTNKIALISGLGCLALVGTGFAAWTYTESNTANSAAAGTVASIKTAGTVAVTGTLSFVIDQADSEYNGKLVWSGTVTPVYTVSSAHESVALTYSVDATAFKDYFTLTNKITNWVTSTAYKGEDLFTVSWAKKVPTAQDYDAMYTAINGKSLTITFKAANTIA